MIRVTQLVLALVVICGGRAGAQDEGTDRTWPPWRTSYFPYVTASPNDGLMGVARLIAFRQADYDDRVSLRSAVAVEAGYSTRASRFVSVRGDFPRIAAGWRLAASAAALAQEHFGDPSADLSRVRYHAWADATRRLSGPALLAVRVAGDRTGFSDDAAAIASRYPYAPVGGCLVVQLCDGSADFAQQDAQLRAALVIDLRDREYDPRRGALLEVGGFAGTAADGYHGGYAIASGWLTPREGTRLTTRLAARALSQSGAVAVTHEIPAWERPITVVGGSTSHRALGEGELVGRGVLMAGAEARHDLLNFGAIGALTLIGFVDGGRVFNDLSPLVDPDPTQPYENGALRLTLDDWTVGVGGGVALRILRAAQLTMTVGRANERTRVYVSAGTSW